VTVQPDLQAVLDAVRILSPSSSSPFHGEYHWRRVATNGLDLAAEVGADPLLVVLFGIFHDSMRYGDGPEDGHGRRGGALARRLNAELLGLPDDRLDLLDITCKGHTDGKTSQDPTIGACWDADRRDLCRLGRQVDLRAMSTAPGRTTFAHERAEALLVATPEWPFIFDRLRRTAPEPLERRHYDAATLMRRHPPVLRNPNKQVVYRIACPDGTVAGHVSYSRWAEMPLPATADPGAAASLLQVRDGFFDYEPVAPASADAQPAVEWQPSAISPASSSMTAA
jgi:uncharacterized protein